MTEPRQSLYMGTVTNEQDEHEAGTVTGSAPLDPLALAGAAAGISAAAMLVVGVFGAIGVYEGAVEMMEAWHLFFAPTVVGTVAGMIEAAVVSFVLVYPFAWAYNVLAR